VIGVAVWGETEDFRRPIRALIGERQFVGREDAGERDAVLAAFGLRAA
jgi:hypothetical protein